MDSKLSRLSEAIIEAGWLAALIIVPLFFNVHSSRVFEPDKISLLRSIALIMAIAWIVKLVDGGLRKSPGEEGNADNEPEPSLWQRIRQTPLVLPTLILVAVYLLSTILSLEPRISWGGSYQRLQGTYTTLSYIVIFFLMLGHLRQREQWHRIIFAIILTSLPIAIYGILQRAGLDPLPWGGNVQRRIAANMGNAIFVAAYLLMAFFLTLQRFLIHFARLMSDEGSKKGFADAILAGSYLFIVAIQLLAIFYSQSRGPFLALGAGLFVFGTVGLLGLRAWAARNPRLGNSLRTVAQWLWVPWIGIAVAGIAFLVIFNLPNTPLEGLRANPYIGRLGTALDFEARTAKVRTLIWQGATELIQPHEPIEYPATGGQIDVTTMTPDRVNGLRSLVGYGPESMWMAFNRFYPPDLAHYEARNASPDRSHNETFDALVTTGLVGFLAYMTLFMSVFYYSLKWLGLIRNRSQFWLFIAISIAGAGIGALVPYLTQGDWILSGLTLPIGLIAGIVLFYIPLAAVWNEIRDQPMKLGLREFLILTAFTTIIAHFTEIHFGIAIASTRTYFWVWSATLVVVGMNWLPLGIPATATSTKPALSTPAPSGKPGRSRSRRRRRSTPQTALTPARSSGSQTTGAWGEVIIYAVLAGIILFTLAYDFTISPNVAHLRETSPFALFWHSFTSRVVGEQRVTSAAALWMVIFTWFVGMALALFSIARDATERLTARWLGKAALIFSAISIGIFLVMGLIHASRLASDVLRQQPGSGITLNELVNRVSSHIFTFYLLIFVLILLLGVVIWRRRPGSGQWLGQGSWFGPIAGVGLSALALFLIVSVNINLVRADIIYKQGQAYDSAGLYEEAIFLYDKAIQQQPTEDYYYLFLGRAQLERARQASEAERENFIGDAYQSLLKAQNLNPLNTDHTANLGRLFLAWAQMSSADRRQELIERSLNYYQVATDLSPNAAHLHNEYGSAYQVAGDDDKALEQYLVSLELDQEYPDTFQRLGDFFRLKNEEDQAIQYYEQGLEIDPDNVHINSNLGFLYAQRGNLANAIERNEMVLQARPNDLASARNLAILYQQTGDLERALDFAKAALQLTQDENDRASLLALIQQLEKKPGN
ncbi:MAG: tetratricopeptide repeat protein [Chloroflexota bacterium]|nr:tetratricopeptide repeat protein [Chloroflexota bacterium]